MLTTGDAFAKFRSRLELNEKEQKDASRQQRAIREHMSEEFDIAEDFLTGSYARHTKTKPLKDVDIFCVLGDQERHYRDKPPSELLGAVARSLAKKYGQSCVTQQRRSVNVDFGVTPDSDDKTGNRIVSFDVVPAFALGNDFEIPDTAADMRAAAWTKTNPRIHAARAVEAQQAYSSEWKGLVRMAKYWNNHHNKPIRPSFLIEVMALDMLHAPYGGDRAREMQFFFAAMAGRIHETWADPAGLGPPVSDAMDSTAVGVAQRALRSAERGAALAIALTRQGRQGDALKAWQALFGPRFPLT